jgi:hypothetical protein
LELHIVPRIAAELISWFAVVKTTGIIVHAQMVIHFLRGDTNLRNKNDGNIHWYRVGLKHIHGMKHFRCVQFPEALRNAG